LERHRSKVYAADLQLAFAETSEAENGAVADSMPDFGRATMPYTLKNYQPL
jgi:hypothetical protein